MDIIKRLDVEQKGVGARAAVLWLTASDTGLQVASGIVTLLFAEGEMGVESQCPSRDRWAYCPVGKKSHNSASGSHVCNPSSSDLWSAVISHSWQSDYSQQPLNSSHIQVALDSTRLLVKTVFRVEGWGRTATKNVCELWHRGLDISLCCSETFSSHLFSTIVYLTSRTVVHPPCAVSITKKVSSHWELQSNEDRSILLTAVRYVS